MVSWSSSRGLMVSVSWSHGLRPGGLRGLRSLFLVEAQGVSLADSMGILNIYIYIYIYNI